MNKKTIANIDWQGKRALVRVDFNVPMRDGQITDDTRIRAALPTIHALLEQGASLVLMSHLGRPKGEPNPQYSLQPVAAHLATLLDAPVHFCEETIGPVAEEAAMGLKTGDMLLLENTRFNAGETKNGADMAQQLAKLGDVFVNDAFGSAHRAHASTTGVAQLMTAVAGLLMEKELNCVREPQTTFCGNSRWRKNQRQDRRDSCTARKGRRDPHWRWHGKHILGCTGS